MNTRTLGLVWFTVVTAGCSSVRPKPLDFHVNVGRRITALEQEVKRDQASIANLLVPEELNAAERSVREARRAFFAAERRDKLLEKTGLAEARVEIVRKRITERQPVVAEVLREREHALISGALNFKDTRARFEELDELFRERFPKSGDRRDRLRKGYHAVEVNAVDTRVLALARAQMRDAESMRAQRAAPRAFKTARAALRAAEEAIARDPRREEVYRDRVTLAENLTRALGGITAQAQRVSVRSNEAVARELLKQKQRVEQLRAELAGVELNARVANQRLRKATLENQVNRAVEQARQDLGDDTANVYRTGDRLLIRLKANPTAPSTLTKVKGVIQKIGGHDVIVQGGTSRRAEAVTESLNEVTRVGRLVGPDSPAVEILMRPRVLRR